MPIVPIVMGGGDYATLAPPHSVIDVNYFPSVQSLANYLEYLMKNPVSYILEESGLTRHSYYFQICLQIEYLKYFTWKNEYMLYEDDPYCTLCSKLHDPEGRR